MNNINHLSFPQTNASSTNYKAGKTASSPDSIPNLLNDGVIVHYKQLDYESEIIDLSITKVLNENSD
jgi:hypothetical protein